MVWEVVCEALSGCGAQHDNNSHSEKPQIVTACSLHSGASSKPKRNNQNPPLPQPWVQVLVEITVPAAIYVTLTTSCKAQPSVRKSGIQCTLGVASL